MKSRFVRLYNWLLTRYPESFHTEFGDEMRMIFQLRLDDAQSNRRIIEIFLFEMIDLVPNILREHYTQRQLMILKSGGVMTVFQPRSFYRWSMNGMVLLTGFVLLMIVVPFFINGIYQHPSHDVYNALYDPKGFAPFKWGGIWSLLHTVSMAVMLFFPVWCGMMIIGLSLSLFFNWHQLNQQRRQQGIVSLIVGCLLLGIWFLPIVQKMMIWLLD